MPYQNDLQNRYSEFKMFFQNIKVLKKEAGHEFPSRSILRNSFFMTRRSSILDPLSITIYYSVPAHW